MFAGRFGARVARQTQRKQHAFIRADFCTQQKYEMQNTKEIIREMLYYTVAVGELLGALTGAQLRAFL